MKREKPRVNQGYIEPKLWNFCGNRGVKQGILGVLVSAWLLGEPRKPGHSGGGV